MGLDPFTDEVVFDVNVFGVSMVGRIFGEDDGSDIVIADLSGILGVPHEFN